MQTKKPQASSVDASPKYRTLVDILDDRATLQAKPAYIFLKDGEEELKRVSFKELQLEARAYAAHLQTYLKMGDRALLLIPDEELFVPVFWGCMCSGIVAIPSPAFHVHFVRRVLPRIEAILEDAKSDFVITTKSVKAAIIRILEDEGQSSHKIKNIHWICADEIDLTTSAAADSEPVKALIMPHSLAFLQYTSGSTSTPKGVMVSHENIIENYRLYKRNENLYDRRDQEMISVNWLPLYHDMGLICGMIRPVFTGETVVIMKPIDFLQRPARWLRAMSKYKASFTAAPNFAFALCNKRVTEAEIEGLNLEPLKRVIVAAEPVRWPVMKEFIEKFKIKGFPEDAITPGYGLAEATLHVSGQLPGHQTLLYVDPVALKHKQIKLVDQQHPGAVEMVSCGDWGGLDLRIVDGDSRAELSAGHIGEIWISGAGIATGYWNNPKATKEVFEARLTGVDKNFLRTGDLGFILDGRLYIAGRIKDLIIIRGKNHYPQDIELTVENAHSLIRQGCVAVFSTVIESDECIVIAAEVRKKLNADERTDLIRTIKMKVTAEHDLSPKDIVLMPAGTIYKTSSGKIQRQLTKQNWNAKTLERIDHKADIIKFARSIVTLWKDGGLATYLKSEFAKRQLRRKK